MHTKRLIAGLTAITAALAGLTLGIGSANADTLPQMGTTLTITAAKEGQLAGRSFDAYKLAGYTEVAGTGSVEVTTEGDPVLGQVRDAMVEATKDGTGDARYTADDGDPLAWATNVAGRLDITPDSPWAGRTRVMAEMIDTGVMSAAAHTAVADAAATQLRIDGLQPGLYLVTDAGDPADGASWTGSLRMIASTALTIDGVDGPKTLSDGTINLKNEEVPVPDKDVDDPTPSAGQNVTFTVHVTIPGYIGYRMDSYTYRVRDSFTRADVDAGRIAYHADGIESVTVDGHTLTADDYTLTYHQGEDATGETTDDPTKAASFRLDLSAYIRRYDGTSSVNGVFTSAPLRGADVVITYRATAGVIGVEGVANKPVVDYSNKPGDTTIGTTPGPSVRVYNLPLTIVKTDRTTGKPLAGAEFEIVGTDKPGVSTPIGSEATGSDGTTTFTGLGAATVKEGERRTFTVTYTLKETKAPDGHILPADATFTVRIGGTLDYAAGLSDVTYEIVPDSGGLSQFATADSQRMSITVQNARVITELPLTGGAGMALSVASALLFAGAAGLVVATSRSDKRDTTV